MQIAITGAGLLGSLLNWQLSKSAHEVTVFESSSIGQKSSAAYVAASMLAPCSERIESSDEVWDQGIYSLYRWPEILQELDVPYGIDGSIVVAHGSDLRLLKKFESTLRHKYDITEIERLDRKALARLEPDLSPQFHQGLFLPLEGWLDNRSLLRRLAESTTNIRFDSPQDPQALVDQFDVVVDCRGVGAKTDEPELRSVRGEVVRVFAPEVELTRPIRLMHPKYQIYIAPRAENEYVIGATQIESDSTAEPSVQSLLELLSAAYTVDTGFAEAEVIEINKGLRPAYPDNEPRVYWRDAVLSVNGLYRHGYLIAPAIVAQVVQVIEELCALSSTVIR